MLNLLRNEFIWCGKIAPTFHFYFLGTVKTKNGGGRKVESKRPRPNFSLLLFATVKNGLNDILLGIQNDVIFIPS